MLEKGLILNDNNLSLVLFHLVFFVSSPVLLSTLQSAFSLFCMRVTTNWFSADNQQ